MYRRPTDVELRSSGISSSYNEATLNETVLFEDLLHFFFRGLRLRCVCPGEAVTVPPSFPQPCDGHETQTGPVRLSPQGLSHLIHKVEAVVTEVRSSQCLKR